MSIKNAISVIIIVMIFAGCKEKLNPVDENSDAKITKSPKRGLAYNLTNSADFDTLKNGVSWWYNWYMSTSTPANYYSEYKMEFVPMLWGGGTNANDIAHVKYFILSRPEIKYLLAMNEPNLTDQANRTPQQAAADWLRYEQVVNELAAQGRTIYLVGPQMNWGTLPGYSDPVVWLDSFFVAFNNNNGRDPRIDYLAFHWYDYGLASQLDRLQKYGKKIWITEMANWNSQINSYEKQAIQMREMVDICETRSDVFRYAWFIGRGNLPDNKFTYIFNPTPGQLNELGKLYINLPYSK
ncbi:MAG TPA: glycosyl hydrolase [Ignavibacteriaceae bacterium]|nr:glycosyl hydrolase [Ignavibacteriaceae bacterium]